MEPADPDIRACLRMWNALGREELLDIAAYSEPGDKDWFSDHATRVQSTWQRLIWSVLAYRNEEPNTENSLTFQKNELGRKDGPVALIELSSIPALSLVEDRPRTLYRQERIFTIRERMLAFSPQFVVFYSTADEYRNAWEAIANVSLQLHQIVMNGSTAFAVMPHPQRLWAKDPWLRLGRELRRQRQRP